MVAGAEVTVAAVLGQGALDLSGMLGSFVACTLAALLAAVETIGDGRTGGGATEGNPRAGGGGVLKASLEK